MKNLLALLIVATFSFSAFADDQFQHELEFAPALGYSSISGLVWGAYTTYLYKITDHFQLGVGGYFQKDDNQQFSSAHLQADYNFSENFERSYFTSIGAIYNNYALYSDEKNSTSAFVGFGKRFVLSEKNNISYKPFARFYKGTDRNYVLNFGILVFSWDF